MKFISLPITGTQSNYMRWMLLNPLWVFDGNKDPGYQLDASISVWLSTEYIHKSSVAYVILAKVSKIILNSQSAKLRDLFMPIEAQITFARMARSIKSNVIVLRIEILTATRVMRVNAKKPCSSILNCRGFLGYWSIREAEFTRIALVRLSWCSPCSQRQ